MFEGNRFFPLTGTPIPKMLFSRTLLADCEPDPFTVATLMLKSFDYALLRAECALFLTQGQVSCRHLAGFPSGEFPRVPGPDFACLIRPSEIVATLRSRLPPSTCGIRLVTGFLERRDGKRQTSLTCDYSHLSRSAVPLQTLHLRHKYLTQQWVSMSRTKAAVSQMIHAPFRGNKLNT